MACTSRAVRSSPPPTTPVGVFWDYENCRIPTKLSGFKAVSLLRAVAHSYGHVQLIKAYMETSLERNGKASNIRSELQSSGVSIIDTPHNGSKDVADKMILVDMLTFALDTKAPATVVLVSGDKDFAYALGTLRNRRYKVIVIAPESASESLRAQADQVLDWRCGVLEMPALSREEKAGKKGMKRGAQEPARLAKRPPVILQPMNATKNRYQPYQLSPYTSRAEPPRNEGGASRAKAGPSRAESLSEKHWRERWEDGEKKAQGLRKRKKVVEVIELSDTDEEEEREAERLRGKAERKKERKESRRLAREKAEEGVEEVVEEVVAGRGKGKGKAKQVDIDDEDGAIIFIGSSSPSPPPENLETVTNDLSPISAPRSTTLPSPEQRRLPTSFVLDIDDQGYSSSMDTSLTMDTSLSSTVSPHKRGEEEDEDEEEEEEMEEDDYDGVELLISQELGVARS